MTCVGRPPLIRASLGSPEMPYAESASWVPRAGGFLPASVDDQLKRNSSSDELLAMYVVPSASCLFCA
jgi:hypothetical protein